MPRLARTVCARVPHHLTQRGNRREKVFFTDDDRHAYLGWLKEYAEKHEVDILAYCLMPNHIHLVAVPATADSLQQALNSTVLKDSCCSTPRLPAARALRQRASDGAGEAKSHAGDRPWVVTLHRTERRGAGRFRVGQAP